LKEVNPILIKTSDQWDLTGTPILIDDANPANDWDTINSTYDWCNGIGTLQEPYIIENVTINGQGAGICIDIRNSNSSYFKIKNCTLFNATTGIKLYNTTRGSLIDNLCTNNSQYGIYLEDSYNNVLAGNNASYNGHSLLNPVFGIYLFNSHNNTLFLNNASHTIASSDGYGIYLESSNYCNVSKNTADYNEGSLGLGIMISSCENTTIDNNFASFNDMLGIYIAGSLNCSVYRNIMNNDGLFLEEPFSPNIIDVSNLVNGKPVYFYYNETALGPNNYTDPGQIQLANCKDSIISEVNISFTSIGVAIHYGDNITIENCSLSYNTYASIVVISTNNSKILRNFINHTMYGIFDQEGRNNTIHNNTVIFTTVSGIFGFDVQESCNFSKNYIAFNEYGLDVNTDLKINISVIGNYALNNSYGIFISSNVTAINNRALNNTYGLRGGGIFIRNNATYNEVGFDIFTTGKVIDCFASDNGVGYDMSGANLTDSLAEYNDIGIKVNQDCTISNCTTINNTLYGIYIAFVSWNNILFNNTITNNNIGLFAENIAGPNLIYNNYFIGNTLNAQDNGTNNQWDNTTIGNYWDDYMGIDSGGDGIGDTWYNIDGTANANDTKPIYILDNTPPEIKISNPLYGKVFDNIAPGFVVEITDNKNKLNDTWYMLYNGTDWSEKFFFTNNDTINQTYWDFSQDGVINITFYANDTDGNLNWSFTLVCKDTTAPNITVYLPANESNALRDAPVYEIVVMDLSLNTTWYKIDTWFQNFTFIGNGTLNETVWQFIWDAVNHGDIIEITFYANDTFGRETSITICLKKYDPSKKKEDEPKDVVDGGLNIPAYDLFIIEFILIVVSMLAIIRKLKLKKYNIS